MKIKLEENVLNETVKCKEKFSCLTDSNECLCEVVRTISEKFLFIEPVQGKLCNYMISFGYSYYCNCPTRKEIYKLYRI